MVGAGPDVPGSPGTAKSSTQRSYGYAPDIKRLVLLISVAVAALASLSSPSAAVAVDYDCADFSNQAEAQGYLSPGDPHGLDGDYDGIACESLPCPCSYGTPAPPPPPPAPEEPPEEARPSIRVYVACGLGKNAPPARECPHRSRVGAFFRSSLATTYTVCVKFPTNKRLCARGQEAEAGVTYVNKITTSITGWHKVLWYVDGRRIVRTFWRR